VKGAIFDLDGVLVNSMPYHVQAWMQAFRQATGIELDRRTFYVLEGMRGTELVEKVFRERGAPVSLVEEVIREKDAIFKSMPSPPAFGGVKEMISSLRCAKAVVSGSSRHDVESVLDAAIGKDLFDVLITADDVKKGKPDPLAFQAALERMGIAPKDAVVAENAPFGVRAANNAGIPCYVVLNNTLLTRQDFAGLIPEERILEKTSSLRGVLEQMCK
jgi:beta-phosphoglucomutase